MLNDSDVIMVDSQIVNGFADGSMLFVLCTSFAILCHCHPEGEVEEVKKTPKRKGKKDTAEAECVGDLWYCQFLLHQVKYGPTWCGSYPVACQDSAGAVERSSQMM